MAAMHIVCVCHQDGRSKNAAVQKERLCLLEGISAPEVSQLLGALFQIPSHQRVVGLATLVGVKDVVIPLMAACRYPGLLFPEKEALPRVFRIVTKDADHEDEILFPISALIPPPPPGCSHISATWALALPELRVAAAAAAAVPELVSTGALTPRQGAGVAEMIRAEDPVMFAACRVAGAAASGGLPSSTAASVAAAAIGGAGGSRDTNGSKKGRGGGSGGGGGDGSGGWEWNQDAQISFASMVKTMLADRGEKGGLVGGGGVYSNAGMGDAAMMGVWEKEEGTTVAAAARAVGGCVGGAGGGGARVSSEKEPTRGRRPRDLRSGDFRGEAGGGDKKFGADGRGTGDDRPSDTREIPPSFQADVIALADIALVTGKINKEAYTRALYKAVTLETGLVCAYRDDTNDNHHHHHHYQRRQGGAFPHATLRAFGGKSLDPSAAGAVASATSGAGQRRLSAASSAQPYSQPSAFERVGAAANGGSGGGGGGGDGGGGGGQGTAASESNLGDGLWAREAALRVEFLLQALSLIEDGGSGLSARHRAVVEHAITDEHPWVAAIYDECKETGDVRGLMQNLQCLPGLLERDQAAALAANLSEPPPPGEADSPFWPRQQQQQQQQQQRRQHDSRQRQQPQQQHQRQRQQQQQQQQQRHQQQHQHHHQAYQHQHLRQHIQQHHQHHQHQQREHYHQQQQQQQQVAASYRPDKFTPAPAAASNLHAATFPASRAARATPGAARSARENQAYHLSGDNPGKGGTYTVSTAGGGGGGGGGDGDNEGDGRAETAAFNIVIAQLCRVIAGCSQLLRLRGSIGEREERALSTMSGRGSPVLLAAVEAYGLNQDLEDLLETLQTAVDVELSLTAIAVGAPGHENASPPLRKLPHQRFQQSPFARQALSTGGSVGGGSGRSGGGGDGSCGGGGGAGANVGQIDTGSQRNGAAAVLTPEAAAASAVRVATRREAERKEGASPPTGNRSESAVLTSALAAVATTAAAAGKRRQDSGGSPGKNGARAVGSSRSGSGSGGGAGSINAPSISGEPSDTPTRRGHHPGKSPPDRTENDTAATAADGARGMVRPAVFGGAATASVPMPTARMAAVRARAEELAAAKFAGMRSAAKAKDDVHAAAGGAGAGPSAPSFDQGAQDGGLSGDKRLRRDVSQLIGVMAKQGMVTDRQRLFLLAQVGRRTTKKVRERHSRYLETGSSKELYAVLMALAAPPRRSGGGEGDEEDDEEEEEEDEEEGDDEEDKEETDDDSEEEVEEEGEEEEEEEEGKGIEEGEEDKGEEEKEEGLQLSLGQLGKEATAVGVGGRAGAHGASGGGSGGSGLDCGGVKRALEEVEKEGGAGDTGDACDAPEL